jgi:hypothetical protein
MKKTVTAETKHGNENHRIPVLIGVRLKKNPLARELIQAALRDGFSGNAQGVLLRSATLYLQQQYGHLKRVQSAAASIAFAALLLFSMTGGDRQTKTGSVATNHALEIPAAPQTASR